MTNIFSSYGDDLFKKLKLKHHRYMSRTDEVNIQHDIINSNQESSPEIDSDETELLTPKIDDRNISIIENHAKLHDLCGVCNDKATGKHYGIATCEGCKGFFKRTVRDKKEYRCYRDGSCLIDKFQRTRCQHCRFQKCLIKGMAITHVQLHRTPAKHKTKKTQQLNLLPDRDSFAYFDKLSTLDLLFDHLRPLLNDKIFLTKEIIKKTSCLLIDTFINWYRTLPFYSSTNFDFNQLVLDNQWMDYIILVIFYFLKINFSQRGWISHEKCCERMCNYTQNSFLSSLSHQILDQFLQFLSRFCNIQMNNTEFTLVSILLIFRSNQLNQIKSLREVYLKIFYKYENNTFPSEQPMRYNQLLDLLQQIHFITQILLTHQHFYLPFLLIPN